MRTVISKSSDLIARFKIGQFLDSINTYVLVSIILIGSYLSFELNGNEEQYMLYAKQFMDPEWIQSRYLNEFPGTRLLYQIIIGFFLKYLSFEKVVFIFKLFLCLIYAHSLSKIYNALKFKSTQILLQLPILFLLHQSMFGESWMFISVEPKGFSYIFVLYALYHYIKANFRRMIIFLIIGTYFHVLVGGYAFIFLMASLIFLEHIKKKSEVFKLAVLYLVLIAPFLFYLKTAVSGHVDYAPSVDWIYSYFRSPHHTGLFRDMSYFYSRHFYGICLSLIALWFSLYYFKINKDEYLNRMNNFILISLLGVLVAVFIALIDREGILLKYYPFRINTLTTFVLTLLLSSFIFSIIKSEYLKIISQIIVLISIVFLLRLYQSNVKNVVSYFTQDKNVALIDISNYIKENTSKDAVVLSFLGDLSLNRRMERDRFVVYKFIPAEMNEIPEWYERELFKRKMGSNIELLTERKRSYKIDYLLAKNKINSDLIELIKTNNAYYLYKIKAPLIE